ncbi:hypothetical protein BC832DRAFT_567774 [Gaertneriomyces semiglobifer]|nr:hypothetical protein BC832DRAFT_567774 [Gaertneriomyces semiglobifer]
MPLMPSRAPCRFYALGSCQRTKDCPFSHDRTESANLVCQFYQRGQCRYGDYCVLKHMKSEQSSKRQPNGNGAAKRTPPPTVGTPAPASPSLPSDHSNRPLGSASQSKIPVNVPVEEPLLRTVHKEETVSRPDGPQRERSVLDDLVGGILAFDLSDSVCETPSVGDASQPAANTMYFHDHPPTPLAFSEHTTTSDDLSSPEHISSSHSIFAASPVRFSYSTIAKSGATKAVDSPQRVRIKPALVPVSVTPQDDAHFDDEAAPLCPFAMNGNCRYGDGVCRYLHGLPCPVCGKECLDPRKSMEVHMEHIEACERKKEQEEKFRSQLEDSEDVECVVCMERVLGKSDPRFGLLNCEHCVCLACIRQWRTSERMDTAKSCPICRTVTHFITPSAVWPTSAEHKTEIIEEYKQKLSTIDCKHFGHGTGQCPFGTSCFYRHVLPDGTPEQVVLRKVHGDEEGVKIVGTVKLSDFLEAWDRRQ